MKVAEGGMIEIEQRDELDTMIAMIECYLKNGDRIPEGTKEDLLQLKRQLDSLWYAW